MLEKKKLAELLAALFVGVIFISSYAAFGGSSGGQTQKQTTTTVPGTVYVSGSAVAKVVSYGKLVDVKVSCRNASAASKGLSDFMSALENNGLIGNFYSPADNETLIELGNTTAPAIYAALSEELGKNATCTAISATQATVQIPSRINVTYTGGSTTLTIPAGQRNYSESLSLTSNTSNKGPSGSTRSWQITTGWSTARSGSR